MLLTEYYLLIKIVSYQADMVSVSRLMIGNSLRLLSPPPHPPGNDTDHFRASSYLSTWRTMSVCMLPRLFPAWMKCLPSVMKYLRNLLLGKKGSAYKHQSCQFLKPIMPAHLSMTKVFATLTLV